MTDIISGARKQPQINGTGRLPPAQIARSRRQRSAIYCCWRLW
jgi:hypothetical protein